MGKGDSCDYVMFDWPEVAISRVNNEGNVVNVSKNVTKIPGSFFKLIFLLPLLIKQVKPIAIDSYLCWCCIYLCCCIPVYT